MKHDGDGSSLIRAQGLLAWRAWMKAVAATTSRRWKCIGNGTGTWRQGGFKVAVAAAME